MKRKEEVKLRVTTEIFLLANGVVKALAMTFKLRCR